MHAVHVSMPVSNFLYKGTKCSKGTKGLTIIIVKVTLHLKFDELSNRSLMCTNEIDDGFKAVTVTAVTTVCSLRGQVSKKLKHSNLSPHTCKVDDTTNILTTLCVARAIPSSYMKRDICKR